jgi:hypothetical protein
MELVYQKYLGGPMHGKPLIAHGTDSPYVVFPVRTGLIRIHDYSEVALPQLVPFRDHVYVLEPLFGTPEPKLLAWFGTESPEERWRMAQRAWEDLMLWALWEPETAPFLERRRERVQTREIRGSAPLDLPDLLGSESWPSRDPAGDGGIHWYGDISRS